MVLLALVSLVVSAEPRPVSELRLLYFHSRGCGSCAKFDAQRVLEEVKKAEPGLTIEPIEPQSDRDRFEQYGIEYTPTLVLVDKDGFALARPRIDLADAPRTTARIVSWVRKATGRKR
jgi:thioredoxin-related protein